MRPCSPRGRIQILQMLLEHSAQLFELFQAVPDGQSRFDRNDGIDEEQPGQRHGQYVWQKGLETVQPCRQILKYGLYPKHKNRRQQPPTDRNPKADPAVYVPLFIRIIPPSGMEQLFHHP